MVILVESYTDSNSVALPARFYLGKEPITAVALLDQWVAEDHSYFKVRGSDGALYILRHDLDHARWTLVLFDNGDLDPNIDPVSLSTHANGPNARRDRRG